jgi:glutamate carboxypeptidase
VDEWVGTTARELVRHAERELEALVGVSSQSGDARGAEEAIAVCSAVLPTEAEIERPQCSSPGYAPDLLATLRGSGEGRLLLLGHVDTVVAADEHRPLERSGGRLIGSGTVDMKGGVVLSLGIMRALALRPEDYEEVALLLVTDEEWRTHGLAHAERFAGFTGCLCFEAGQLCPDGGEGVIVRRKAAGTLRVEARGVSAHSGSAPDKGRNALLALAAAAAQVASCHDPRGEDKLSAVPTIMNSGEAFNVVPSHGELFCDLRADSLSAFERVIESVPGEVGGATLQAGLVRQWPGMDARESTRELLERGGALLGRPILGLQRGGASDASHIAQHVPLTVDGLGPRGGGAHNPGEYVLAESIEPRAQVALALVAALLGLDGR